MAEDYGAAALTLLEEALLHDDNADVRASAAETIGDLETERAVDILAEGLEDPNEDVREAVVDALIEIGGKQALPALQRALQDGNEDIREAAADAIEEIKEDKKQD
jgi:HEAT repeat protein